MLIVDGEPACYLIFDILSAAAQRSEHDETCAS
jgi:hypothetical protein